MAQISKAVGEGQGAAADPQLAMFTPSVGQAPPITPSDSPAIWGEHAAEATAIIAAQQDDPRLANLAESSITATENASTGISTVDRIKLADGNRGYRKPIDQPKSTRESLDAYGTTPREAVLHECAAYHAAKAMGSRYERLVPACALREEQDVGVASVAAEREGSAGYMTRDPFSDHVQVDDAAFFDVVVGNQDRHGANFLIDYDGNYSLIDHGCAFGTEGGVMNQTAFVWNRAHSGRHELVEHERATLQRLADSPDLGGIEPMLSPVRAGAMRDRILGMLRTNSTPLAPLDSVDSW